MTVKKLMLNNLAAALSIKIAAMNMKLFTNRLLCGIILKAFFCFEEGGKMRMIIRSNLSTLMGARRYSIKDVHEKTGLSRGTISSLYNDKATRIDYDTIAKLCELFGCEVGSLLVIEKKSDNDMEEL